jgi:hypothetical protein
MKVEVSNIRFNNEPIGRITVEGFLNPHVLYQMLAALTRQQLRNIARKYGVPTGRDRENTISNLMTSGKIPVTVAIH